jgi:hypothetical protein
MLCACEQMSEGLEQIKKGKRENQGGKTWKEKKTG